MSGRYVNNNNMNTFIEHKINLLKFKYSLHDNYLSTKYSDNITFLAF